MTVEHSEQATEYLGLVAEAKAKAAAEAKPDQEPPPPEPAPPEPQPAPQQRQLRAPIPTGHEIRALIPKDNDEVHRLATMAIDAGMAPKGLTKASQVGLIILKGLEIGMAPVQALQSIGWINGKMCVYGDGLLAVVLRSGLLQEIKESVKIAGDGPTEVMIATCRVRRGGHWTVRTFSKQDAQVANLWGKRTYKGEPTPWLTYPKRMLQMRARAFALRDAFADILGGMGSAEEQSDITISGNGGTWTAPPPPPAPAWDEKAPVAAE